MVKLWVPFADEKVETPTTATPCSAPSEGTTSSRPSSASGKLSGAKFSCDCHWRPEVLWWLLMIMLGPLAACRLECGDQISAIHLLSACSGMGIDLFVMLVVDH